MNFKPKTNEELAVVSLLKDGIYEFYVHAARDEVSKSGNEMIKLTLSILNENNQERFVFDYLLESMAFKLKHFCESIGLSDLYELGTLKAENCLNKKGKVHIIVELEKPNPKGGWYPPKNVVKDYVRESDVSKFSKLQPLKKDEPFIDSDLPF